MQDLDARFATKALTYVHITAGLLFVGLVPLPFASALLDRMPRLHRIVGRVLLAVGSVAGVIAFPVVLRNSVGGVNEATATIFIASLFLFSLGKAFWFIRHRNTALHRE